MDDILGRHNDVALARLPRRERSVTRVTAQEGVADWTAKLVQLNAKLPNIAGLGRRAVVVLIKLVSLKHLKSKVDFAAAKLLPHHADEHFAALAH